QYEVGNFRWKDGTRDGEVEFVKNPNGRFKVMYHPPAEYRNLNNQFGEAFEPGNKAMFCAGVDTYDHRKNSSSSKAHGLSMGALVILKKPHPVYESRVDGGPACIYLNRPAPEVFYED